MLREALCLPLRRAKEVQTTLEIAAAEDDLFTRVAMIGRTSPGHNCS
jgi:hypothetical protein